MRQFRDQSTSYLFRLLLFIILLHKTVLSQIRCQGNNNIYTSAIHYIYQSAVCSSIDQLGHILIILMLNFSHSLSLFLVELSNRMYVSINNDNNNDNIYLSSSSLCCFSFSFSLPVEVLSVAVSGRSTPPDRSKTWAWLSSSLWMLQDRSGSYGLANATGLGARTPRIPLTHFAVARGT